MYLFVWKNATMCQFPNIKVFRHPKGISILQPYEEKRKIEVNHISSFCFRVKENIIYVFRIEMPAKIHSTDAEQTIKMDSIC